jgi:hypothetical protein
MDGIKSFREFWPYYLSEHSRPATRWIHFFGTTLALVIVIGGTVMGYVRYIPIALIVGYGPAWYAHFKIEKNRPATFKYPFWSFFADFKMWFLMLTGQLK